MITRCSYYAKLVNDLVTRTIAGTFVEGGAIAYNCVKIWNSFSHKVVLTYFNQFYQNINYSVTRKAKSYSTTTMVLHSSSSSE